MSRKDTESFIIKNIDKLTPKSGNSKIYKDKFAAMTDKEFDSFIERLESGEEFLTVIEPNFDGTISVGNNLALAEELGHTFFERLWVEPDNDDETAYLTPIEHLIMDMPLRRASQTIGKKSSIPDDNKVTDSLTGQVTGASKGAKISYPELQVAAAMELEDSMVELTKFRGGDIKGQVAYNKSLSTTGTASQKVLENFSSGVESTKTLKTFLTCMMLKNTL